MARKYARLKVLEHGDDWSDLSVGAQWLYVVLLRQPKLSVVGTLDVLPRRWVTAWDATTDDISMWLGDLESHRYVVVDRHTDELAIRTFTAHDLWPGSLSARMVKGVWNAYGLVASATLREVVATAMASDVWTKCEPSAPDEARRFRMSSPLLSGSPLPLLSEPSSPFVCPESLIPNPEALIQNPGACTQDPESAGACSTTQMAINACKSTVVDSSPVERIEVVA